MNPRALVIIVLTTATLLLASGCGGAFQKHFERGHELYKQGQLEPALDAYERALATDPESVEALHSVARLRGELFERWSAEARAQLVAGNYPGALDTARRIRDRLSGVEASRPFIAEVVAACEAEADALGARGEHARAITLYEQVISVDANASQRLTPRITENRRAISRQLQGQAAERHAAGDYEGARALYRQARDLLPQGERRDIDLAILDVQRDWSADIATRAEADLSADRFEAALGGFERARELLPEGERAPLNGRILETRRAWSADIVTRADAALRARHFEDALSLIERARGLLPEGERGPLDRKHLEARRAWAKAITKDGDAARARREFALAVERYRAAAEKLPEGERDPLRARIIEAQREWSRALAREAQDATRRGDFALAVERYQTAIELLPEGERGPLLSHLEETRVAWATAIAADADRAAQAGDHARALQRYDEAIGKLPEHRRAPMQARRQATLVSWAEAIAADADRAAQAGDHARALQRYDEAIGKLPEQLRAPMQARRQATQVSWAEAIAAEADQAAQRREFDLALQRYEEAIGKLPEQLRAPMRARRDAVHQTWADALLSDALDLERGGQHGAALVLALQATHHSSALRVTAAPAAIKKRLLDTHRYLIRPRSGGWQTADLAALATLTRGPATRQAELSTNPNDRRAPRAWLQLDLANPGFDVQVSRARQTARYQSGVSRRPNPAYAEAKRLFIETTARRDAVDAEIAQLEEDRRALQENIDQLPPRVVDGAVSPKRTPRSPGSAPNTPSSSTRPSRSSRASPLDAPPSSNRFRLRRPR